MPAFSDEEGPRLKKSEEEWRRVLSGTLYRVMRKQGTERAFSNPMHLNKDPGTYICAGCGQALFDSTAKYDSGTGWPSFFKPLEEKAVETSIDKRLFHTRIEVHCARCGSHLGHLFEDGPSPSGKRYCINAISLEFKPR